MRFYVSLYLLIVGFYLLTASGRIGLSDGVAMYNVAQSIAKEGSLSSEPCSPNLPGHLNHCVLGEHGRYYAGFGLFPSLVAVPAIVGGKCLSEILHLNASLVTRTCVSLLTALVSPLICVVLAMWIIRLGYSRATAAIGACILAFASPLWNYGVKGFFSEPYFTLGLLLAAYLLSSPQLPFASLLCGLAFGAACASRLNGTILFPVFILSLALQTRERGLSRAHFLREAAIFTIALSICGALIGWSNYARFGSIFKTGYHLAYPTMSALFSTPWGFGMRELLLSREVGLFSFVPWALLAFFCFPSFLRMHRVEAVLCGGIFLCSFLFFAKYDSWHGGWVAGPRFLLPTLPFLFMLMVPSVEKLRCSDSVGQMPWGMRRPVIAGLVLIAFLIQATGTFFPLERYYFLQLFYEQRPVNHWWSGSIPLASLDFLYRMTKAGRGQAQTARSIISDQPDIIQEQQQALADISTAADEDDFLRRFPNSENLMLPNLFVVKVRWLGFPAPAVYGYVIFALTVSFGGLVGVKRYAALSYQ